MIHPKQLVSAIDTRAAPHGNSGNPDKCFYCPSLLGTEHSPTCVCRLRTVVVRATVEYTIRVPEFWAQHNIEFARNEGSWCADNMVAELNSVCGCEDVRECLCGRTKFEFVREATQDDEDQGVAL